MASDANKKSPAKSRGIRGAGPPFPANAEGSLRAVTPSGLQRFLKKWRRLSLARSAAPPITQRANARGVAISGSSAWKARPHSFVCVGHSQTIFRARNELSFRDSDKDCGATSNSSVSGLPDSARTRVFHFFTRPYSSIGRQPIEMPRRAPRDAGFFPARLQPFPFFEAHENGVECAGSEPGLLAESVAVVPAGWMGKQRFEHGKRLWRDAQSEAHLLSLHK